MKHKSALFAISVVVVVLLAAAWGVRRNSRIDMRFRAVHAGASEIEVVELMGKPSWIEPCGTSFGTAKPNCTEFIYRNSFAPLVPEYHSVSLDSSGRVQDSYIYLSL